MRGEIGSATICLPPDWWQQAQTAKILSQWFERYVLPLALSFRHRAQPYREVATGFLIDVSGHLLWLTAGHVVRELGLVLTRPDYAVERMLWLDRWDIPGAEALPAHNRDPRMYSEYGEGIDIGALHISGLDECHLRQGQRVEIMSEQAWSNLHLSRPEGYYLIGYPREWKQVDSDTLSGRGTRVSLSVTLACLPVQRIRRPSPDREEGWDDPDAFYGEILAYAKGDEDQPRDIVGMSGGPLFSIERDVRDRLRYHLVGLQASWSSSKRQIRVEPIERVVERVRQWLEEQPEQLNASRL